MDPENHTTVDIYGINPPSVNTDHILTRKDYGIEEEIFMPPKFENLPKILPPPNMNIPNEAMHGNNMDMVDRLPQGMMPMNFPGMMPPMNSDLLKQGMLPPAGLPPFPGMNPGLGLPPNSKNFFFC